MRGVLVVLAWASALVAPPRPPARRRCRLAAPEKAAEAPAESLFRGPPELLTVRSEALLVAQAGLVGAATGVAVSGFKLGIDALEQASYGAYVRDAFLALPGGWSDDAAASALVYASVPALGGAAVGLLRAATPGFGDAASRTAPATALSRAAAAVATLGTGNSLGPEGPAVELGEALAARVDGGATSTDRRRRILRAAGGAAGVAAGFSAPIAGVFFALEVAYRDAGGAVLVLPRSAVAATAVASVVAAVVSQDVLQVRLALARVALKSSTRLQGARK